MSCYHTVGMRFEPRTLSGGSHRVLSLGCRFSTILTFRALCFNRLERGSYKGRGEAKGGPKSRQGWQRRHSSLSVPHGRTQWRRRLDVFPRSSATKVWAISFRRCHLLSDRSPERREPVEGKSWGNSPIARALRALSLFCFGQLGLVKGDKEKAGAKEAPPKWKPNFILYFSYDYYFLENH